MSKLSEIEKIQRSTKKIANGKDSRVKPGQPERFTTACVPSDCIRQGDLYIVVAEIIPGDYVRINKPKEADKQLDKRFRRR